MNNIIAQLLQQNRAAQQNSEGARLLENLWAEQRRQIAKITDVRELISVTDVMATIVGPLEVTRDASSKNKEDYENGWRSEGALS